MANESGDMKVLGNFRKLVDLLAAEPAYAPPNPKLQVAAMNTQHTAGLAAAQDVPNQQAPNKVAITERQLVFDQLPIIVPRSYNLLRASGARKEIVADADTSRRKVLGRRKSAKIKNDPNTPANDAAASHSAAQTSYEAQTGSFGAYVAILKEVPEYQPNDNSLKISALTALHADLQAKSNAVSSTFVPLSQARGLRDALLYDDEDSVVNIALLAKTYVAGEFGRDSKIFKQIKGLEFKRARQR